MGYDLRRRGLPSAIGLLGALYVAVVASAAWAQSHDAHGHVPQAHPAAGGAHEGHGMNEGHGMVVVKGSEHFPTIGYDDTRNPRPAQTTRAPAANNGDPRVGKLIAQSDKGRCLNCHVLDQDGILPGDVGPNLSTFATWGRDPAFTFQQVWDARVHNPQTIMPPFGTNELLDEAEVAHIVAYLYTLKQLVVEPQRAPARRPRERVYVAGLDFSAADDYTDAGSVAFQEPGANGRSCASCHAPGGRSLDSAASRYPRFDQGLGRVVGLEERINDCRQQRMASDPFPLVSQHMNELTGFVKFLGRGKVINIQGDNGDAAFERGRASFYRRAGQLNFSCASCHENSGGMWLRGQRMQKLDQIVGQWPKHYIALHDLGLINLRQRIQHCQIVMSTFPLPLHAQEYLDLEYYLTRLASGNTVLAPTMTRLRGE